MLLTVLLILTISSKAFSIEYYDTKGTDFRFAFLPNAHKTASESSSDSLFIFIAVEKPTDVSIEYYDRTGNQYNHQISITQANSLYKFQLQYYNYELWGYCTDLFRDTRFQSEMVSNMSFHITSNEEITVYAHSQARQTSAAFLVLPTDVLDNDYIVISYNSDSDDSEPMPSEFAIVATEDNTNITIIPSQPTRYNELNTQKLILDKGEVYLVQADMEHNHLVDLTGTIINADKPVALFSGQQKSGVPVEGLSRTPTRDCLMEQIPPVKVWSNNAFITPFAEPSDVTNLYDDLFRITAAYDSTTININGTVVANLNQGEFYEDKITQPSLVTSNSSFLLVQYKKSSDYIGSGGSGNNGDAFMLVVPPKEQFLTSYTTINVQAYDNRAIVYNEQYITIVIPTSGISSFRLDNNPVNSALFNPIQNSGYSFASIPVNDGVHKTASDSAFGIYIYGYGLANSFGYTGGMSFKPIDFQGPQISQIDSCYKTSAFVTDSLISDSGLKEFYSPISSQINCEVKLSAYSKENKVAKFEAYLNNKKLDGSFKIIAEDSLGHATEKTIDIKGFTLGNNGSEMSDNLLDFTAMVRVGATKCFDLPIHNYGKFDQTILGYKINNRTDFSISPASPITIRPGEVTNLRICFTADIDSMFVDTLSIINDCGDLKTLADFTIQTGIDKITPKQITVADSCNQNFQIFISDSTFWDSGISSISILYKTNCNIAIHQSAYTSTIIINIINTSEDMSYGISIIDSAGHELIIADTISSTNFRIYSSRGDISDNSLNFGDCKIGYLEVDSLTLFNSGTNKLVLENIILAKNTNFSIPQSQFPITIEPMDSAKLFIVFSPVEGDSLLYTDSLLFKSNCLKQSVVLTGYGESINLYGASKCEVDLKFSMDKVKNTFYVSDVMPNPIISEGIIVIHNDKTSMVQVDLFDYLGNQIKRIANNKMPAGKTELSISPANLSSGMYFIRITKENINIIKTMLIE